MNLKKIGKVFTSKFVGTGPSSSGKRIYRAAVSQRLRNTGVELYLYSPYGPYGLYRASVPVQRCTLPYLYRCIVTRKNAVLIYLAVEVWNYAYFILCLVVTYHLSFTALLWWLGISRYEGGRCPFDFFPFSSSVYPLSVTLNQTAQIIGRSMKDKAVSLVD